MASSGVDVRLRIEGYHPPGRRCGPYEAVPQAWQGGRDPAAPVRGRRGERLAASWGPTGPVGLTTFRRAEPVLDQVPALLPSTGAACRPTALTVLTVLTVRVDLIDERGMSRCARLRAPAISSSRS